MHALLKRGELRARLLRGTSQPLLARYVPPNEDESEEAGNDEAEGSDDDDSDTEPEADTEPEVSDNNDDSDGTGMELVQEDSGYGIVRSISSSIEDGFDIEGVESIK